MDNAPAVYEGGAAVVNFEEYAMNMTSLVKQVDLIQQAMGKVMTPGEHYGVIPGTKKPTLLKPGAEVLAMMFRLDPQYEIIREVREEFFVAYTVRTTLYHIPTGQRIGSGLGSCNTRENKYRWRYIDEMTDTAVPSAYWEAKEAGNSQEMKRILGDGNRARKNEESGKWVIATSSKIEHDNPWEFDNTILKMACKRALVAAVLNATAASSLFTQDIEDMPDLAQQDRSRGQQGHTQRKDAPPPGQSTGQPRSQATGKPTIKDPDAPASEAQIKLVNTLYGKTEFPDNMKYAFCAEVLGFDEAIKSTKNLTKGQASTIIDRLNSELEVKGA